MPPPRHGARRLIRYAAVGGHVAARALTLYTPVGLPWQDLALAWAAYCHALAEGLGTEFDFLA